MGRPQNLDYTYVRQAHAAVSAQVDVPREMRITFEFDDETGYPPYQLAAS